MNWFRNIFARTPNSTESESDPPEAEQGVLIVLNGNSLSDQVYEECDIETLESLLAEAMGELGECDGCETGPSETVVYLYGTDAEAMFRAIEPVLLSYPLAATAKVTIRQGPPGAPERVLQLP